MTISSRAMTPTPWEARKSGCRRCILSRRCRVPRLPMPGVSSSYRSIFPFLRRSKLGGRPKCLEALHRLGSQIRTGAEPGAAEVYDSNEFPFHQAEVGADGWIPKGRRGRLRGGETVRLVLKRTVAESTGFRILWPNPRFIPCVFFFFGRSTTNSMMTCSRSTPRQGHERYGLARTRLMLKSQD